jgi:hypothetical protein
MKKENEDVTEAKLRAVMDEMCALNAALDPEQTWKAGQPFSRDDLRFVLLWSKGIELQESLNAGKRQRAAKRRRYR